VYGFQKMQLRVERECDGCCCRRGCRCRPWELRLISGHERNLECWIVRGVICRMTQVWVLGLGLAILVFGGAIADSPDRSTAHLKISKVKKDHDLEVHSQTMCKVKFDVNVGLFTSRSHSSFTTAMRGRAIRIPSRLRKPVTKWQTAASGRSASDVRGEEA